MSFPSSFRTSRETRVILYTWMLDNICHEETNLHRIMASETFQTTTASFTNDQEKDGAKERLESQVHILLQIILHHSNENYGHKMT